MKTLILLLLSIPLFSQSYVKIEGGIADKYSQQIGTGMAIGITYRYQPNDFGAKASYHNINGIEGSFDSYKLAGTYLLNESRSYKLLASLGPVFEHGRFKQETRIAGQLGITNLFKVQDWIDLSLSVDTNGYGSIKKFNTMTSVMIGLSFRAILNKEKLNNRFF